MVDLQNISFIFVCGIVERILSILFDDHDQQEPNDVDVKREPVAETENLLMLPLHITLGLMKRIGKALNSKFVVFVFLRIVRIEN